LVKIEETDGNKDEGAEGATRETEGTYIGAVEGATGASGATEGTQVKAEPAWN